VFEEGFSPSSTLFSGLGSEGYRPSYPRVVPGGFGPAAVMVKTLAAEAAAELTNIRLVIAAASPSD
jgi:hypothetical protein